MRFTLDWLRQYIDFDLTSIELADRLTMLGLEVDAVGEVFPGLEGVKVARVMAVRPHPNADSLVLCDVDTGADHRQVVCGAPNVRAGMFTAIALPDAVMPDGLKIKKAKIRDQISEGMLCSEKDLGISDDHAGVMDLAGALEPGAALADVLGLRDTFIEVDLTPNRPDCASIIGIAREVAGFGTGNLRHPLKDDFSVRDGEETRFSVTVEAAECSRYAARLMSGVSVGPSPWWLRKRLLSVGMRPVNNVVDITNFVMLEYGQPLHAFDFNKLAGGRIVVRNSLPHEKIVFIDHAERELEDNMLLICDAEKPVAVAGVMGGMDTEVDENTTEILLESACFDPVSIRRTVRRLNLGTESSYRFERGVDPEGAGRALARAVQLIAETAGATAVGCGVDCRTHAGEPLAIDLRVARVNDLAGYDFQADEIAGLLSAIEIEVDKVDDHILTVRPPSFRVDLVREIDLVEEVVRLKGYNEIPSSLPSVPMSFSGSDAGRKFRKEAAAVMTAVGFSEAINYSFVSPRHFDMLDLPADDPRRSVVRLLNPLAEDSSVMRTTLLPGLLENVCWNLNRQNTGVKLFEIGKVFYPRDGQQLPDEEQRLTAVVTGGRYSGPAVFHYGAGRADLYDIKGYVEQLLAEFRLPQVSFAAGSGNFLADSADSCRLLAGDREMGEFGRIREKILREFGIKQEVLFLDLNLDALGSLDPLPRKFKPLPKFPAVRWDIALLVPADVGCGDMLKVIDACGEPLVEKAKIFDIFKGEAIEPGYKSVAISVTYRSAEKTLDDDTVGRAHEKILRLLIDKFNGKLREV